MGYYLNVLGILDLRDADGILVTSVLQQPRRTALLVYLALADREAMVKRDRLLGLFWPDMTQDNGRRALSQAIHFLRKSLGRDAIIGLGNEDIALNREVVDCDAARFNAAVRAGDLESAAAGYGGDLLPGFFVSGLPEFDQWLSGEREALRRAAAQVFWSVAEEAKLQGYTVSAAASARRAAELASENESATRRLMEFLESIDDRAGALDAYDGLVRRLQVEYESTPSAKTREIADRIRHNGGASAANSAPTLSTAARLRTLPWQDIRRRSMTLTGALIIMVATLSLWGLGDRPDGSAPRADGSVVIGTAEVFDGDARGPAARIMADAAAALVAVPELTVYAPSAPSVDAANAYFRLEPKVASENGMLRITANLIDVSTGKIVRSAAFSAQAADTAALTAAALDMSEFARKAMGRYLRATQIGSARDDAEILHQSMLDRLRSDSLRDEGQAAYAALTLKHADSLVEAALRVRRSADLFIERAEIARAKAWLYGLPPLADKAAEDRAAADGVRYADAAIKIEPRNAAAHQLRGLFAVNAWLMPSDGSSDGRDRDEAERYLRTAVELDPLSARAWSYLSTIFIAKGEFGEAYYAAERAHTADTYMDVADAATANLFSASLEMGDMKAAARWCSDMSRRAKDSWVGAYCQLNLIAQSDGPSSLDVARAQRLVAEALESPRNSLVAPVLNSVLSVIYARAGDDTLAAQMLPGADAGPMGEEAQPFKAWALLELGGHGQARAVLESYVGRNPSLRGGLLRSVRFASLR